MCFPQLVFTADSIYGASEPFSGARRARRAPIMILGGKKKGLVGSKLPALFSLALTVVVRAKKLNNILCPSPYHYYCGPRWKWTEDEVQDAKDVV